MKTNFLCYVDKVTPCFIIVEVIKEKAKRNTVQYSAKCLSEQNNLPRVHFLSLSICYNASVGIYFIFLRTQFFMM